MKTALLMRGPGTRAALILVALMLSSPAAQARDNEPPEITYGDIKMLENCLMSDPTATGEGPTNVFCEAGGKAVSCEKNPEDKDIQCTETETEEQGRSPKSKKPKARSTAPTKLKQ